MFIKSLVLKHKIIASICTIFFALNIAFVRVSFAEISPTDSKGFVVLTDVVPDAIMET